MSIEDYEPVASRLARFWATHPDGRIITSLVTFEGDRVIAQCDVYFDRDDLRPVATDFAEELRGSNNVNKTSHIENALTSATGRALADCNFASSDDWNKRPSREEMQKVQRMTGQNSRPTAVPDLPDEEQRLSGAGMPLASEGQRKMIWAISKSLGKPPPANLDQISKQGAMKLIDALKEEQQTNAPAEEVF
jgi:hypothetical protein